MNQVIYFAAGCFWGAQHFFVQVDGVCEAVAGYANGRQASVGDALASAVEPAPTYEQVYTDTTGFAETVRVRYDDRKITLRELVRLFFTIIDPTSVNRQGGGDVGALRTYFS